MQLGWVSGQQDGRGWGAPARAWVSQALSPSLLSSSCIRDIPPSVHSLTFPGTFSLFLIFQLVQIKPQQTSGQFCVCELKFSSSGMSGCTSSFRPLPVLPQWLVMLSTSLCTMCQQVKCLSYALPVFHLESFFIVRF